MKVFRDPLHEEGLPERPVVSIGNFDGVHLGHRAILAETVRRAREAGAPAGVVTFDPHPLQILAPEKAPRMLQTLPQKLEQLAAAGLDAALVVPFTRDFSLGRAEDFVRSFLVGRLGIRAVVIGRAFRFGHGREGSLDLLRTLGAELGFDADGVPDVVDDGGLAISSTRIRAAVAAGDVAGAQRMLGRPFTLHGIVERGSRVGRKLGYPTVNLRPSGEALPGTGVYVTRLEIPSLGRSWRSVTNVGVRPTVWEGGATTVEAHLFDFDLDVYGEPVLLSFLARLREERKFPSLGELTEQIARDVAGAEAWFAAEEPRDDSALAGVS
jgi:riboflavin kinase / FMN adenylyltransferase